MKFDQLTNKLLNAYVVEKHYNCKHAAEGCCCDECEECAENAENKKQKQEQQH